MPAYWTAGRIANQIHRQVLAPHGFIRRGRECERQAGGLRRTLSVHTRANSAHPQVQVLAVVAVAGLSMPVTSHRCDSLGGTAQTATERHYYLLPGNTEPLPPELLADAAGPILAFLLAAEGLAEFVLWAQEVFAGQEHPGWWGRFRPVTPQGTGPLQAAAFAAALLSDPELVEFLTALWRTRNTTSTASTTTLPRSASSTRTCATGIRSSALCGRKRRDRTAVPPVPVSDSWPAIVGHVRGARHAG